MPRSQTLLLVSVLLLSTTAVGRADPPPAGGKSPTPLPPPRVFPEPSEAERRILSALAEPADFQLLDASPLSVAKELETRYGFPFRIDWPALQADGKDDAGVFFNKMLRGIPLRSALKTMLDEHELAFVVHDGAVLITTRTQNERYRVVRTYQVHDLVVMPNDPTAAQPDFESLIELITSTIQPETWRVAGGTQGECKQYLGAGIIGLVITQTYDAHDEIAELLGGLRAARLPQVARMQADNAPVPRLGKDGSYAGPVVLPTNIVWNEGAPAPTEWVTAKPPEMTAGYRSLVDGQTEFACRLYGELAKKPGENVVFSPFGIANSLETLRLGARRRTAEELRSALGNSDEAQARERLARLHAWLDGNKGVRGYHLASRTHLLVAHDEPLLASFVGAAGTFGARIQPIDFSAGRAAALMPLLDAIQAETGGPAVPQGLTDDVDENTRMYLLNTTSFRGKWSEPFASDQTLREVFRSPTGDLKVEMMHGVATLGYREIDGLRIVGKEYDGLPGVSRGMFYVVLPSSAPTAPTECERNLSQKNLARWLDGLEERPIELHLPKFAFDNLHDLRPALESLGVRTAFAGGDTEVPPDFSGINGARTLGLQGLRQQAKIEVDETQTEAASYTAIPLGYFGGRPQEPEPPKLVRCDHLFLFVIRDEHTRSVLFMGRVAAPDNDPTAVSVFPPLPK